MTYGYCDCVLLLQIHHTGFSHIHFKIQHITNHFPTFFRSSSPTISQAKQHDSHDFSEAKFPIFPFFSKCSNYIDSHFPDRHCFVDYHLLYTNKKNLNQFQFLERPKYISQLFPKFTITMGTLIILMTSYSYIETSAMFYYILTCVGVGGGLECSIF